MSSGRQTRRFVGPALATLALAAGTLTLPLSGAAPITYRFSFPAPEHHWMQVDAHFPDLPDGPLDLRMSRSSPGRYAIHDFAKNVYDVEVTGADGGKRAAVQPDPSGWRVDNHGGAATVRYKVFGDRVDGTYLAIDPTHAHINMPAAILFARGLDDRPATVTFSPPRDRQWRVATQLFPGSSPLQFTAPNLQYLMDSPVEFGPVAMPTFTVDGRSFRFAVHHDGSDSELQRFVADVRAIVAEQGKIFGGYPRYEPGHYTFLADYLRYANGDGMEHRNSTVVTAATSIREDRLQLLNTIAHEFFHNWNIERIRPRSLEPFNFEAANIADELWLGEGFTQYYGPLTLSRTGLADVDSTVEAFAGFIRAVSLSAARQVRSADAMSRMATFTDGGRTIDRTNWSTTYVSYYPFGAAIALALDLSLRERFDGKVTLDDFMRAMWETYGAPGGSRPGYVDRPYTQADAEAQLARVTGDPEFARAFFARFVTGHELPDYAALLKPAGILIRPVRPNRAWFGGAEFIVGTRGLRIDTLTMPGTPLHTAGIDRGDELLEIDGARVTSAADVYNAVAARRPGDRVRILVSDRGGATRTATVTLAADPAIEVLPAERAGQTLTDAEQAFRRQWLGPRP